MKDFVVAEKHVCYKRNEKPCTNKQTKTNKQINNDSSLFPILLQFDCHFYGRFRSNTLSIKNLLLNIRQFYL